tara:strand:- start:691 stop:969 length:279 start_codon:yes stop_codon:yes gene_type:complete
VGVISAIVSLIRALPILERLLIRIADGVLEAKAKERYESKLVRIDNRVDTALRRVRDDETVQRGGSVDGASTVRGRRKRRAGVDKKRPPATG